MKKTIKMVDIPQWVAQPMLDGISFFKQVLQKDPEQFEFIRQHSVIQEIRPGEPVIREGEIDNAVYFLLLGHLQVYNHFSRRFPIDEISPGQMFGEMALLGNLTRGATVVGDSNSRRILVLRTDFSPFGELNDASRVSYKNKVIFYQAIVEVVRQRVAHFMTVYPEFVMDHPFKPEPAFEGQTGGRAHLLYLAEQAKRMSGVLKEWNDQLGGVFDMQGQPKQTSLKTMLELMGDDNEKANNAANPFPKEEEKEDSLVAMTRLGYSRPNRPAKKGGKVGDDFFKKLAEKNALG